MDIKYPIENEYMKCVLQINGFSGPRPQVRVQPLGLGAEQLLHVSLDLRCSRISWMLILYFDLDPYFLFEVALWVIVEYNLRYSKVIE